MINRKILLYASAIFMGAMGVVCTFLPQELLGSLNIGSNGEISIIVQIIGALYFGFALMNWTVKGSLIGGIYNKPIVLGNSIHFMIATFALLKSSFGLPEISMNLIYILTGLYAIFAASFISLLFTHPKQQNLK